MKPFFLLGLSIFTLSQAGNIIRLCDAPPPVVAFYRLLFAFLILFPFFVIRLKKTFRLYDFASLLNIFLMGLFFALHFFTWIESIQHTTVANAAILFSIAPILTAIGSRFFYQEKINRGVIVAMIAGVIGVLFTGVGDFSFEARYLYGDFMGILAAIFFALYFLMGKKVERFADFFVTMPLVFLAAGFVSLICILALSLPLSGFSTVTWGGLLSLGIFPTIIGHGLLIYSLKFFKSSTVSTLTLVEPVLAGLGAWLFYGEAPFVYALLGYTVMALGLGVMFNSARK